MIDGQSKLPSADTLKRLVDEGLTHGAISQRYGVHPTTVRNHLIRAGLLRNREPVFVSDEEIIRGLAAGKSPTAIAIEHHTQIGNINSAIIRRSLSEKASRRVRIENGKVIINKTIEKRKASGFITIVSRPISLPANSMYVAVLQERASC